MSSEVTEAAGHVDAATKAIAECTRHLRPATSAWKDFYLHRDRRSPTRRQWQTGGVTGGYRHEICRDHEPCRVDRHGICGGDRVAGLTVTRFRQRLAPREFSVTKFLAEASATKFA